MQLKALLFASWISCCSGMEGGAQGENAFLQHMSMLATAAANAASAAERAIGLMSGRGPSSSSHASGDGGLQAATRKTQMFTLAMILWDFEDGSSLSAVG